MFFFLPFTLLFIEWTIKYMCFSSMHDQNLYYISQLLLETQFTSPTENKMRLKLQLRGWSKPSSYTVRWQFQYIFHGFSSPRNAHSKVRCDFHTTKSIHHSSKERIKSYINKITIMALILKLKAFLTHTSLKSAIRAKYKGKRKIAAVIKGFQLHLTVIWNPVITF